MNDLIKRADAIKALKETEPTVWTESDYELGQKNQWSLDTLAIECLPPAEPKKGRWIIVTIGEIPRSDSPIYEPIYRCSRCGMSTESYVRFEEPIMPEDADFPRYCPNCGSSMEVRE